MKDIGFIILRHVNNEVTNKYWIHSYQCIRKYYPENKILIIDDNSDKKFITNEYLYKTTIINSEFPKRGELLFYYYYLQNKLFDTAVLIHDSVFINKYIDMNVDKYRILWDFQHNWDNCVREKSLIRVFNDRKLLNFYRTKEKWVGCFGSMCIITHDYLTDINNIYDISKLLGHVICREDRIAFERVIACLLQINEKNKTKSLLGNIMEYCKRGIKFHEKDKYRRLPIIKVWTGR